MITYNKYTNNIDYTWYDSTNVIFSKCYDNDNTSKTLKIVFKNGRTYLYKDVAVSDYICFKNASSNGSAVNEYIVKKYKGVRIMDTNIDELERTKNDFINEEKTITEEVFSNLMYQLVINNESGEFLLKLNNKTIYSGIEGQVSIVRLLKSMNINYMTEETDTIINENDENKEKIELNNE